MKKMKVLMMLMLAAVALLASCNLSLDSKGKAYILCAGVEYGYDKGPAKLDGCIDDAIELGTCLTKQISNSGTETLARYMLCRGENPDESSADYPSPSHILSAINAVPAGKEDLLVFFYSGHGEVVDGRPCLALPPETEGGFVSDLDMKVLYEAVEAKGCHAVILMDCCYSGATAVDEQPGTFSDGLTAFMKDAWKPSVAVIAACQADEQSSVSTVTIDEPPLYPKQKHGYLTIGLLKGLGWAHSRTSTVTVMSGTDSYRVHGRVDEYLEKVSVSSLEGSLRAYWSANYTMKTNETRGDLFLIP